MKQRVLILFLCLSLAISCQQNKSIVVVFDNDVHCSIDGYPQFAGLRDAISEADTAYVLTVSCGDYAQGGIAGLLSKGEYPIEILNSVGYDVVTIGNHEFDYKLSRFNELVSQINASVVCANLTDMQGKRLFEPYVIRKCGNRKIAFIGALTPQAMVAEAYCFFDKDGNQILDLNEDRLVQMVQDAADEARAKGADYVVVLSHLGEKDYDITSRDLIARTCGIDALLDGHTHSVFEQEICLNKNGEEVVTCETGTGLANMGKLLISRDGRISTELIPVSGILQTNAEVQAKVDEVKAKYQEIAARKIGVSECHLSINDAEGRRAVRRQECSMGDFVADAYRIVMGADVALVNGGGVRADLNPGDITYMDVVNVQPFGNEVSLIKCKGSGIVAMLKAGAVKYPGESGGFLQVSGLKYTIDSAAGNDICDVQVLDKLSGKYVPVKTDASYLVAATSFLMETFVQVSGPVEYISKDVMPDYEVCLKYIEETLNGRIGSGCCRLEGRINEKQ